MFSSKVLYHNPGIFIGLGGAGVKSLVRLKAKMYELYKVSPINSINCPQKTSLNYEPTLDNRFCIKRCV